MSAEPLNPNEEFDFEGLRKELGSEHRGANNDWGNGGTGAKKGEVRDKKGSHDQVGLQTRIGIRREELKRLLLSGYGIKECAKYLGVSLGTLRSDFLDPEFQTSLKSLSAMIYDRVDNELAARRQNFQARLHEMAEEALDEMEGLMYSGNDNVKIKACQDVLDRDGRAPRNTKVMGQHVNINVDMETLLTAAMAADEELKARGS